MKTTVDFYDFARSFEQCRPDNFSREGLMCLFEYFEQFEADTGEELELDVIAFCCDFSEDTWQNIAANYSIDLDGCDDDEERQQAVADYLTDEGAYIGTAADSFVYRNF
jgi:hypothetical protein